MTLKRQRQTTRRRYNKERRIARMDREAKQDVISRGMDKIMVFLGFEAPSVTEAKALAEVVTASQSDIVAIGDTTGTQPKELTAGDNHE